MATTFHTNLEVHRHASDDVAHDCGRACAQMVISSLTQGVLFGVPPTPAQQTAPVPVTQILLQSREVNSTVDVNNTWFTDPDEMLDLLQSAPELVAAGLTNWRLAVHSDFPSLMADVGLSLHQGMPAVLNIRSNDHWVVVRSVDEESGSVSFVEMLDPLDRRGAGNPHTYVDRCSTDGESVWETFALPVTDLGNLDPAIGNTPPANYQGRFIAVVYGQAPDPVSVSALAKAAQAKLKHVRTKIVGPGPVERIMEELRRIAGVIASARLRALLDASPPVPVNVQLVRDIDGSDQTYFLASLFSKERRDGLLGVFSSVDSRFVHLRFTTDEDQVASLQSVAGRDLWWTRRNLLTLGLPYYPFLRDSSKGRAVYTRVLDGYVLHEDDSPSI